MIRKAILLAGLSLILACKNDKSGQETGHAEGNGPSLFEPEIELENQLGQTVEWNSFKGKISVVSMIFTHCEYACPLIIEDLKSIDNELKPNVKDNIQYLLISFDTENDKPDTLLNFHKAKNLDKRWQLLHGDEDEVRLLSNVLEIKYKKDMYGNFAHSNTILVLDKNGELVKRTDKLSQGNRELPEAINSL